MPENSMAAFRAAVELGAGIECDLRSTADRVPIIFHDEDLQRLCGTTEQTRSLYAHQLEQYRLLGTDETIPSLLDLLSLVRGRVPLLLEIKRESQIVSLCRGIAEALLRYQGPFAVMSFDWRVGRWFKSNAPHVRRGIVIGSDESAVERWMKLRLAGAQFAAVQTPLVRTNWGQKVRRRMPLLTWTVRTTTDRKTLADQADALIWEADGRP